MSVGTPPRPVLEGRVRHYARNYVYTASNQTVMSLYQEYRNESSPFRQSYLASELYRVLGPITTAIIMRFSKGSEEIQEDLRSVSGISFQKILSIPTLRGSALQQFYAIRLRLDCMDYFRHIDPLTRKERKIIQEWRRYQVQDGMPQDAEGYYNKRRQFCSEKGYEEEELKDALDLLRSLHYSFSLDECIQDSTTMFHEVVPDPLTKSRATLDTRIDLADGIAHLSQSDRDIISLFLMGNTFTEIGVHYNITHQAAHLRYKKAVKSLQFWMRKEVPLS